MSINKIFALTIVAIFVVLAHGHSCDDHHITVDQVLGNWYFIAETSPDPNTPFSRCVTANVTRSDDHKFDVRAELHRIINGRQTIEIGHEKLVGGLFYGFYPTRSNPYTITKATSYNNGKELITGSHPDHLYRILASRSPTASPGTIEKFRALAADVGVPVVFIPHGCCCHHKG